MAYTTYVNDGCLIHHTAAGPISAGDMLFKGSMAYQATVSAITGELIALRHSGVIQVPKASGTVFSVASGAEVYYDATAKLATTDATKPFIGLAVGGGDDGQLVVNVLLNVKAPGMRLLRARVSTAQVNAGLTLLPAIAGRKYRVHDVALIAIGGAAATATSVDILATQSASSVKLLAAAVAGLTQSALLRAGAANAAILADGASFVPNDANTAITIGKTGSALATATYIDVLLTYSVE